MMGGKRRVALMYYSSHGDGYQIPQFWINTHSYY